MKKYLFLGVALIFLGLIEWHLIYLDFSNFHFYGFLEEVFSIINLKSATYLFKYLPVVLLFGVYLVSLIFAAVFFESIYKPFLILLLAEIPLYFLLPKNNFIFLGLAFALGNLMLIVQVFYEQQKTLRLSFFELSHKALNQFLHYALIILCLYNFVLIQNQPFNMPSSVLNTMSQYLQSSIFKDVNLSEDGLKKATLDFNSKLCDKEGVDKTTCLKQMEQLINAQDLSALTKELGYTSPEELNLAEIINFKIREILEPYQAYLPYFLTVVFFSSLYFLATLLIFVYAIMAELTYLAFLKIGLIRIDIRNVTQEYLV